MIRYPIRRNVNLSTRILIVDDDAGIRSLVASFLEKHGFQVDGAGHPAEMRERLAQADYALIVLDVMMPGEDGLSALRELQRIGGPPVIMLSAVGTDIDRISVRIAGENAAVNAVDARFVHASGLNHRLVAQHAPYDLVFANILARPLVTLAHPIKQALKPGGYALLSGLLRTQERYVRAAYLARGFTLVSAIRRDAWSALTLRRAS